MLKRFFQKKAGRGEETTTPIVTTHHDHARVWTWQCRVCKDIFHTEPSKTADPDLCLTCWLEAVKRQGERQRAEHP